MSAESRNEQEQLRIKDNETVQQEQGTNLTKLCEIDSPCSMSSKSSESIDNYVDVASKCVQISTDTHRNETSCQPDKQISQNLEKPVAIHIGSISEQVCCNDKVDDFFINEIKSSTIPQSTIDKDISDSSRPNQVTELSDDYVMQMLKNLNDRRIALDEGVFFDADKQNSPPLQEASISDESEKADNKEGFDKVELIVENNDNTEEKGNEKRSIDKNKTENNSDTEEKSFLKEKSMSIDAHVEKGSIEENKTENNGDTEEKSFLKVKSMSIDSHIEKDNEKGSNGIIDENKNENNGIIEEKSCVNEKFIVTDCHTEKNNEKKSINENKTGKPDLLPSKKFLIVDESNSANDITEIEKKLSIEKSYDSVKKAYNGNVHPFNNEKIPIYKLENIDLKKAFSQGKLKDISPTLESDALIDRLQHMDWLKPTGQEMMEINKRRMARKSSIDKEECNEDIKEELIDDTKINSKKKRSNQRKNLKTRAADSLKQDDKEDMNKMSSEDVGLTDTSKSPYGRAVEKSKDVKAAHLPAPPRIGIGRGRNDRRKASLGNSQPRGQIDINDQRNKSHKSSSEDRLPTMVEKSFNKSEDHSNAQGSSNKIEKIENFTGNIVVSTNLTKSKEHEVCEIKSDSKLHRDVELSCNQSSVKNTAESSIQENKGKIDIKKGQLPSEDHQQSQNRSATNLSSSRPIYGRSTDKSTSEKILCSVRGFGQNADEAIKNNKSSQNLSSKDNVHKFSEHVNRNQHENKISQSYSSLLKTKEESCSNKYANCSNTYDQDFPRWNHNNYPDKQNVKRDEVISHKNHTSNKHRNIADEKRENEESFGKNQAFADKSQGSKRYSDKCQDNRTSVGRYSDRHQDNNFHDKHSDKHQDDKSYVERYSNRNEDCKSYPDTDRSQAGRRDTYFENNRRNRGFGEKFSDFNQDRLYGSNYSNKFRDGKISSDRYSDDQQSKTSSERFYNKKHNENEMVTKKEESLNKSPVSFDKNENCSDNNHIATKSSDSSNKNQGLPDKNSKSPNKNQGLPDKNNKGPTSAIVTYDRSLPTNEDVSINYSEKNHQPFDQENNYRNQDISNNFVLEYNDRNLCLHHQQEQMEQFKNNFWLPVNQMDQNKEKQYKSDVKSQKHFDNTQQVKVQMGLNQLQQSHSRSPVACQQELSSAVDLNFELNGTITPLTDVTESQPSQSETWSSYKNTSKQDAVYSSEFQSASPYANVNIACSPAVINEYNVQYNQTLMDLSNQFNNTLTSGQKPNVVMAFEGNQNVQRALGMDPRIVNQVNTNDPSRSNTPSPAHSQPTYANENVAQFFQSAVADSQTPLTCMHSTMNVNAQPFEVTKQSSQESNKQQMYAMQPTASNHGQSGFVSLNNDFVVDIARTNEKPNNAKAMIMLRKEIYNLSQQLALKQGQLLALEIESFKNTSAADETGLTVINQQSSPSIQHMSNNNQLVQDSNQILPSSYVQVKSSNYPPGFGDVSMDRQSAQLNVYKMLTNVANVKNYTSDNLPSNSGSEPKSNTQEVYLAQGNIYQQQTATYQMYTDKTANSATTYINMMPQRADQRQIRGVNQFPK